MRAIGVGRDRVGRVQRYESIPNLHEVLTAWDQERPGALDSFETLILSGPNANPELEQFQADLWERLLK